MVKIAAVTGGNRGIGFEIVRQIAEQIEGTVYLTARSETRGNEAVAKVRQSLGPGCADVKFHQLDISDEKSVETFKNFLQTQHGGLDILCNNAGVFLDPPDVGWSQAKVPELDVVKKLLDVNYYGVKRVTEALLPILRPHGRIVFTSSRLGSVRDIENEAVKRTILSPDVTMADLDKVIADYLAFVKDGTSLEKGYPTDPFYMSNTAMIAYALVVLQRRLDSDPRDDIIINCCCPGFTATDMTQSMRDKMNLSVGEKFGGYILRTPAEAVDSLVWCALLPEGTKEPRGKFLGERQVFNWAEFPTAAEFDAIGIDKAT